jgi:hypothetical protein
MSSCYQCTHNIHQKYLVWWKIKLKVLRRCKHILNLKAWFLFLPNVICVEFQIAKMKMRKGDDNWAWYYLFVNSSLNMSSRLRIFGKQFRKICLVEFPKIFIWNLYMVIFTHRICNKFTRWIEIHNARNIIYT